MIAFDTNILVYSVTTDDAEDRHAKSLEIITAVASIGGLVPIQVIGEFLNVCRQKKVALPDYAMRRANEFVDAFTCPETQPTDLFDAFELSDRMKLQFFDALIVTVAARAGATILLSEDMQDGLNIDGFKIVNPFTVTNETLLADYFGNAP